MDNMLPQENGVSDLNNQNDLSVNELNASSINPVIDPNQLRTSASQEIGKPYEAPVQGSDYSQFNSIRNNNILELDSSSEETNVEPQTFNLISSNDSIEPLAQEVKPWDGLVIKDASAKKGFFRSKKAVIGLISFMVFALIVTGSLGAAAFSLGRDNALSKASLYVPFEKIPLINKISKSESDLIRDSLSREVIKVLNNGYKDTENISNFNIEAVGKPMEQDLNVSLKLKTDSSISQDGMKSRYKFMLSGKAEAGDYINLDFGENGVTFEAITPNEQNAYFAVNLSKPVIDFIKKFAGEYDPEAVMQLERAEKFLGKYIKVDAKELEGIGESPFTGSSLGTYSFFGSIDQEKSDEIKKMVMQDLGYDFLNIYNKTFGDIKRYNEITNEGRQSTNGHISIVLGIKVKENELAGVTYDFIQELKNLLINKKDSFVKICEKVYDNEDKPEPDSYADRLSNPDCKKEVNESIKDLEETKKEDIEENVRDMFDYVDFKDIKFFINPVDNNLNKIQGSVALKQKAMDDMDMSKFEFFFSSEEISRGNNISINEPAESFDYKKVVDEIMGIQSSTEPEPTMPPAKQPETITVTPTKSAPKSTNTPVPVSSASTRNTVRKKDVEAIANAVALYLTDGGKVSSLGKIPTCSNPSAKIGTASGNINLSSKLVPNYLAGIPKDPSKGTDANTGYDICTTTSSRIKIGSIYAEEGAIINAIK